MITTRYHDSVASYVPSGACSGYENGYWIARVVGLSVRVARKMVHEGGKKGGS